MQEMRHSAASMQSHYTRVLLKKTPLEREKILLEGQRQDVKEEEKEKEEEEEESLELRDPDGSSDMDLDATSSLLRGDCQLVAKVRYLTGQSFNAVVHALHFNSGRVEESVRFLRGHCVVSMWSESEDARLLALTPPETRSVERCGALFPQYAYANVQERLAFLS
jgi:hypothetical protein